MCFLWVFPPFWCLLKGDVTFCRPLIGLKEPSPLVHYCNSLFLHHLVPCGVAYTEEQSCPSWRAGFQVCRVGRWPTLGSGLGATERGTPRKSAKLWLEFSCKPRHVIKEWVVCFSHGLLCSVEFYYCCCYYYYFFKKTKTRCTVASSPFQMWFFFSPLWYRGE